MDYYSSLLLVFLLLLLITCCQHVWKLNYWRKRGVFQLKPSIIFGNIKTLILFLKPPGESIQILYNQLKQHRFGGIYFFRRPVLLVKDPELIKMILVNDFNYFESRGVVYNEETDPLSAHLFNIDIKRWRYLRPKFAQAFTPVRLKNMFNTMLEFGWELKDCLSELSFAEKDAEMKSITNRFVIDAICACIFGIQSNSIKNKDSEFLKIGSSAFEVSHKGALRRGLQAFFPSVFTKLGLSAFPETVTAFFRKVYHDVINSRKMTTNDIKNKDFINIILQLKQERNNENKFDHTLHDIDITDDLLVAQVFTFFIGGFETSTSVLNSCIRELVINPHIQKCLQEEIDEIAQGKNENITCEAIQQMKYLDCVIQEVLRKHNPVANMLRVCTQNYKIPDSSIVLEKGIQVLIPIYALHHDPNHFKNPEIFDPDRFSATNKDRITPFSFCPFGEGPRICNGIRFAMQVIKVFIVITFLNFNLKKCAKSEMNPKIDPLSWFTTYLDGAWVKVEKRIA